MSNLERQIGDLRALQASSWVHELCKRDPSRYGAFVAWLKESPVNVREFLLAYSLDCSLGSIDSKRRYEVEELLRRINPRLVSAPVQSPRSRASAVRQRKSPGVWAYGVAAGILIAGCIGWWTLRDGRGGWQEFQTGTGEQRALQLEDGTVVHLNTLSRIAVNFSAAGRDVRLIEGEALFAVRHDAQRPFRVFTRDAVIEDLGTQFDVNSRAGSVEVAVIEGRVELSSTRAAAAGPGPAQPAQPPQRRTGAVRRVLSRTVRANEEAQVESDGSVSIKTVPDISEATAWWQRRLVYRKATLARIVEDFNRYNHRRIRLEGNVVKSRLYTGVFDADDADSLAEALSNDPELIVERLPDGTILVKSR